MINNLTSETICGLSIKKLSNKISSNDTEIKEFFANENISEHDKYYVIDYFIANDPSIAHLFVDFFAWHGSPNKVFLMLLEYILQIYKVDVSDIYNKYMLKYYVAIQTPIFNLETIILFINYGLSTFNLYSKYETWCFDVMFYKNQPNELLCILSKCIESDENFFENKPIVTRIIRYLFDMYNEEIFVFCLNHGMILDYNVFLDVTDFRKKVGGISIIKSSFIMSLLKKIKSDPEFFGGDIHLINVIIYTAIKFCDVECIEYIIANDFSFEEIKSALDMYSEPNPGIELIINKFSAELSVVDIVNLCTDNITKKLI